MIVRRLLAALGLAVVIAGAFTLLLARKLLRPNQGAATLRYVVPVRDLEAGEIVRAEDTKVIAWPSNATITGGISNVADVTGRATLSALASGQPISAKQLSALGGVGLSARIPEGMRAISLKSDQVVGVAGFLLPGTHTDVLVTYRNAAMTDAITSTVLQNAEVIAAGQKFQPDPEGKPSTVDVVTLLVSPQDAERVVLASTQGTVHFLLRNGADREQLVPKPIDVATLGLLPGPERQGERAEPQVKPTTQKRPTKKTAPTLPRAVAEPYSIVVVRGDKQTVETF